MRRLIGLCFSSIVLLYVAPAAFSQPLEGVKLRHAKSNAEYQLNWNTTKQDAIKQLGDLDNDPSPCRDGNALGEVVCLFGFIGRGSDGGLLSGGWIVDLDGKGVEGAHRYSAHLAFYKDRFYKMDVLFPSRDYAFVLNALSARLGKPVLDTSIAKVWNEAGVKVSVMNIAGIGGTLTMDLSEISAQVDPLRDKGGKAPF